MPRYVAFLRGVTPTNAKMADLRECLERAGLSEIRTVLASGNVAFNTRAAAISVLERRLERVIEDGLGRSFAVMVRSVHSLAQLIEPDPFRDFSIPPNAKRVVTFLRQPPASPTLLPIERDGVFILACTGAEVLTAYVAHEKGPIFMTMLEKTFGKDITTRTVDTVTKCVRA
jgi:uncharacterized protein (DUF1697 family)